MGTSRPYVVSLKRQDSSSSWGFHLTGGSDYNHPLFVKKVVYGSLAERSGLTEGDEVVQVGHVNVRNKSLDQVHELIFRSGNDVNLIVIRQDSPNNRQALRNEPTSPQPASVKAIVHAQYNSPLNLYSAENIAETIGRTAEIITEGPISLVDVTGPESVSYPKPSAVLQLVQEEDYHRERYHGVSNGSHTTTQHISVQSERRPQYTSVHQAYVTSPAPPPSAGIRSSPFAYTATTTQQPKPSPNGFYPPNELPSSRTGDADFQPWVNGPQQHPRTQVSSLDLSRQLSSGTPPPQQDSFGYPAQSKPEATSLNRATSVCHVQLRPHSPSSNSRPPISPKMTPTSPTGSPSSIRRGRSLWPPRNSNVRELPKTGFSPSIVRGEQAQGKRFVWPPPRPGESDSGRSTPSMMRHHGGHCIGNSWNPSESPSMSRTPPFASSPVPARRCKDDIWPPANWRQQMNAERMLTMTRGTSPRPNRQLHEFDEFVTQHASLAVPVTYHAPPETQHYVYETSGVYE